MNFIQLYLKIINPVKYLYRQHLIIITKIVGEEYNLKSRAKNLKTI